MSALPIIARYLEEYPSMFVIFTVATTSAVVALTQEIERESSFLFSQRTRIKIQVCFLFLMKYICIDFYKFSPVDTPQAVSLFIKRINPSAVILIEGELWPITLFLLSKKKVCFLFLFT